MIPFTRGQLLVLDLCVLAVLIGALVTWPLVAAWHLIGPKSQF